MTHDPLPDTWEDQILSFGYYIQQFSPYHFRIHNSVDVWPTTGRWWDGLGYRDENKGQGYESLLDYLETNYPLPTERAK